MFTLFGSFQVTLREVSLGLRLLMAFGAFTELITYGSFQAIKIMELVCPNSGTRERLSKLLMDSYT
jgi:hypothetical protein